MVRAPFIGDTRRGLVADILGHVDRLRTADDPRPILYCIEADSGWGKTRIVQQVYQQLAERQPSPGYWPPLLKDDAPANEIDRKRNHPTIFTPPADSMPQFMWLGITSTARLQGTERFQAIAADAQQLIVHQPAIERAAIANETLHTKARRRLSVATKRIIDATGETAAATVIAAIGIATTGPAAIPAAIAGTVAWDTVKKLLADSPVGRQEYARQPVRREVAAAALLMAHRCASAGIPLIVAVEDLHSVDETTVEFLTGLLAACEPVVVIGTCWPNRIDEGPASRLLNVGAALVRRAGLDHPLDFDERRQLLTSLLDGGDPDTVGRIARNVTLPQGLVTAATRPVWRAKIEQGTVTDTDLDAIAGSVADLYRDMWHDLEDAARNYLQVAACATPSAIAPTSKAAAALTFSSDALERAIPHLGEHLSHLRGRMGYAELYGSWVDPCEPPVLSFADVIRHRIAHEGAQGTVDTTLLVQLLLDEAAAWLADPSDGTGVGQVHGDILIAAILAGHIDLSDHDHPHTNAAISALQWKTMKLALADRTVGALRACHDLLDEVDLSLLPREVRGELTYRHAAVTLDLGPPSHAAAIADRAAAKSNDPHLRLALTELQVNATMEFDKPAAAAVAGEQFRQQQDTFERDPEDINAHLLARATALWLNTRRKSGRDHDRQAAAVAIRIAEALPESGAPGIIDVARLNSWPAAPIDDRTIRRLRTILADQRRQPIYRNVDLFAALAFIARWHERSGRRLMALACWTNLSETLRRDPHFTFNDLSAADLSPHRRIADLLDQLRVIPEAGRRHLSDIQSATTHLTAHAGTDDDTRPQLPDSLAQPLVDLIVHGNGPGPAAMAGRIIAEGGTAEQRQAIEDELGRLHDEAPELAPLLSTIGHLRTMSTHST